MSEIDNIVIGGSNKELPIHQLNKLKEDNSGRDNIFPLTLLQAVYDKTGIRLDSIISSFNYIFVPYAGTKEDTRLKVLNLYRRKGLVICYKDFEDNVIIEMYKDNGRNDDDWKNDDNWIDFKSFVENIVNTNLRDYITDIKVENNKLQFKSQGDESYSVIFDFKTIFDNIDNVAQTLTKNINDAKNELEKSIEEVSSELNNYKTSNDKAVTGIDEKIESVNKDISDINESIDATNEEITTIKDNIDNISNKVDGLDGTIKTNGASTQYLGGDGKYHNILEYDDVIDVYAVYESSPIGDITNVHLYEDAAHQTEITTGNPKTIYQDITADSPGYQFKWSGSQFIKVGGYVLVLGTEVGTAFEGSAGKKIKDLTDSLPSTILTSISFNGNYEDKVEVVYHSTSKYDPSSEPNYGSNSEVRVEFPIATPNTSGAITAADKAKLDKLNDIEIYKNAQHVLDYYTDLAGCNGIIEDDVYNTLNALIQKTDIRPILISKEDGVNGFKVFNVISARSDGDGGFVLKAIHINDGSSTDNENNSVIYTIKIDSLKNISKTEFTINTNGNGIKYLADDGSYKEIDNYLTVDYNIIQIDNYTLSDEDYNNVVASCQSGVPLIAHYKQTGPGVGPRNCILYASATGNFDVLYVTAVGGLNTKSLINIEIGTDKISHIISELQLYTSGDGNAYLSDDGTYKTINTNDTIIYIEDGNLEGPMPLITETEFNGLISAKNGEGVKVLYRGDTYHNSIVKEIFGITYNDATVDFYVLSNDHIVRFKADKTNNGNDTHNITKDIIPLPKEGGDGTKFLADNGEYVEVNADSDIVKIDSSELNNLNDGTISSETYGKLSSAVLNLKQIIIFEKDEYNAGVVPLQYAINSGGIISAVYSEGGVNKGIIIEPSLTIKVLTINDTINSPTYQFDLNKLISTDDGYTISVEDYTNLNAAINNKCTIQIIDTSDNLAVKKVIGYACYYLYESQVNIPKGSIILSYVRQNASGGGLSVVSLEQIYIKYELDVDSYPVTIETNTLYNYNGDGTKYLSDDGTYKAIDFPSLTLSQTYVPASDKFIPNYPAANDTYEGAIAKLHNMINKLQTRVTELETALTAKEVNDSQEPLG